MLKISVKEDGRNVSFDLEGRLAGPWVPELEQVQRSGGNSESGKPLSVRSLCSFIFIDDDGQRAH